MFNCVHVWFFTVNWLDHSRTFREQGVDENETLLLRRKFFYSDQNVDSRDPVQLNLLYVQVQYVNQKHGFCLVWENLCWLIYRHFVAETLHLLEFQFWMCFREKINTRLQEYLIVQRLCWFFFFFFKSHIFNPIRTQPKIHWLSHPVSLKLMNVCLSCSF